MADATKIGVADATKMGVANARVANATQSIFLSQDFLTTADGELCVAAGEYLQVQQGTTSWKATKSSPLLNPGDQRGGPLLGGVRPRTAPGRRSLRQRCPSPPPPSPTWPAGLPLEHPLGHFLTFLSAQVCIVRADLPARHPGDIGLARGNISLRLSSERSND